MSQPFTVDFGAWAPDLQNVAMEIAYQPGPTEVLVADCVNVYYADGCYRSMPTPTIVASLAAANGTPLSAFTAIDANGNPVRYVGTATKIAMYDNGTWTIIAMPVTAILWAFAQVGSVLYAVDGNLAAEGTLFASGVSAGSASGAGVVPFTGSITSNVLTVSSSTPTAYSAPIQPGSLISGIGVTPGTSIISSAGGSTWNVTATSNVSGTPLYANLPPVGQVLAAVGQFLMQGNIGLQWGTLTAQGYGYFAAVIGTGNGSQVTFSGTLPNVPLRPGTVTVELVVSFFPTITVTDNGLGAFVNAQVNGTINYYTGAISVTFAVAPPVASTVTVSYTQAWPWRVWWSAIANPAFWPEPLTNAAAAVQSSYEDLESDLGAIQAICGYPLYALIFQRFGITRATYVGGSVVFSFATYEWKKGLIAQTAFVQVGQYVYYLSDQGFFMTDGANIVPIGTASDNSAGIDNWFWSHVNQNALGALSVAYDAAKRSIMWAIPTGSNTSPDTLLTYNLIAQRWTKCAIASQLVWSDNTGARHQVALMSQLAAGEYNFELLTGAPAAGYLETCDVLFVDGDTRTTLQVRANIACTDTPQVTIGTRNSLSAAVTYTAASTPNAFGAGFCPVIAQGLYTRTRLTSSAASAFHGATLLQQPGGEV